MVLLLTVVRKILSTSFLHSFEVFYCLEVGLRFPYKLNDHLNLLRSENSLSFGEA